MWGRIVLSSLCFSIAALAGCADDTVVIPIPPLADTVTAVFQDGVMPDALYRGTRDAFLKNGPSNELRNGNFGTVEADRIGSIDIGGDLYETRLIIKMDLSSITDCSEVVSARLTIFGDYAAPDSITLAAFRVIRPAWNTWVEGIGGVTQGVSWTTIDGTAPWNVEGGDFDPAVLDETTVRSDTCATFSLPPALVNGWILHPEANHGIIIGSCDLSRESFAFIRARETAKSSWRPRLEIIYLRGG